MLHAMPLMNLPKNHMTCLSGMTKNSMKMAQIETTQAKSKEPRRLQASSTSVRAFTRVLDVPETFS
jgi:hypothetical protein